MNALYTQSQISGTGFVGWDRASFLCHKRSFKPVAGQLGNAQCAHQFVVQSMAHCCDRSRELVLRAQKLDHATACSGRITAFINPLSQTQCVVIFRWRHGGDP